jgi:hypothetical protein
MAAMSEHPSFDGPEFSWANVFPRLADAVQDFYTAADLENQLKAVTDQMRDAFMEDAHVDVVVDGVTIKTFHGRALLPEQCTKCHPK